MNSDDMIRASHNMTSAATDMLRAASIMEEAFLQQQLWAEDWLTRLEQIMQPEPIITIEPPILTPVSFEQAVDRAARGDGEVPPPPLDPEDAVRRFYGLPPHNVPGNLQYHEKQLAARIIYMRCSIPSPISP